MEARGCIKGVVRRAKYSYDVVSITFRSLHHLSTVTSAFGQERSAANLKSGPQTM